MSRLAPEAAQFQGCGHPAGVLKSSLKYGNQGSRAQAFTPQPEGQADGGNGVGERGERSPSHHECAGYALEWTAAGQPHEAPCHVHEGVEQSEGEDDPGNRQG
ncbi:hypothetical protein StoSoilB13_28120 (plasmid) [Arthrobacter sp. StoSoilB13]|nr:hypothetical protein StoSoilB13_28120 [Arthrobacter sp. StoSoilB13]